jgi:hypothetical protein
MIPARERAKRLTGLFSQGLDLREQRHPPIEGYLGGSTEDQGEFTRRRYEERSRGSTRKGESASVTTGLRTPRENHRDTEAPPIEGIEARPKGGYTGSEKAKGNPYGVCRLE